MMLILEQKIWGVKPKRKEEENDHVLSSVDATLAGQGNEVDVSNHRVDKAANVAEEEAEVVERVVETQVVMVEGVLAIGQKVVVNAQVQGANDVHVEAEKRKQVQIKKRKEKVEVKKPTRKSKPRRRDDGVIDEEYDEWNLDQTGEALLHYTIEGGKHQLKWLKKARASQDNQEQHYKDCTFVFHPVNTPIIGFDGCFLKTCFGG
ncbi:hypothetical protein RJT34_33203 [Clitoria ternatea]|uniref:Uncharacterized protein n=1 Tax=Clitoria ternatea TaxID=43366 RepID=A0AAN9I4F5_CLITE